MADAVIDELYGYGCDFQVSPVEPSEELRLSLIQLLRLILTLDSNTARTSTSTSTSTSGSGSSTSSSPVSVSVAEETSANGVAVALRMHQLTDVLCAGCRDSYPEFKKTSYEVYIWVTYVCIETHEMGDG